MSTVTIDSLAVASWEWSGSQYPEDEEIGSWSREDIEIIVERVNKGAQLLDENNPEWQEKVLPRKLNMANASCCIIGQLYGDFEEFWSIPFGISECETNTERDAIDYGFLTEVRPNGEDEKESIPFALLDLVWVMLLQERAANEAPVFLKLPPQQPRNVIFESLKQARLI